MAQVLTGSTCHHLPHIGGDSSLGRVTDRRRRKGHSTVQESSGKYYFDWLVARIENTQIPIPPPPLLLPSYPGSRQPFTFARRYHLPHVTPVLFIVLASKVKMRIGTSTQTPANVANTPTMNRSSSSAIHLKSSGLDGSHHEAQDL